MNTKYVTLSNVSCVRPVHPGILLILSNATCIASYELKQAYEDNLQAFHKVCGVEQGLIQQVITDVDEKYIISTKNSTTGQFTGNMHQIFVYLLARYGKYH